MNFWDTQFLDATDTTHERPLVMVITGLGAGGFGVAKFCQFDNHNGQQTDHNAHDEVDQAWEYRSKKMSDRPNLGNAMFQINDVMMQPLDVVSDNPASDKKHRRRSDDR